MSAQFQLFDFHTLETPTKFAPIEAPACSLVLEKARGQFWQGDALQWLDALPSLCWL